MLLGGTHGAMWGRVNYTSGGQLLVGDRGGGYSSLYDGQYEAIIPVTDGPQFFRLAPN